jgi:DNA-binding LacI/PurR family transcriptional regulator
MRSHIENVAAVAGVSMKTVSRVLNHQPNVREETRDRVMRAVEQLQYKPNLSARSLAGHLSCMVALVYGNGRLATLQLLERIRTPGAGRMVRVEHTLLFRESTKPPKQPTPLPVR